MVTQATDKFENSMTQQEYYWLENPVNMSNREHFTERFPGVRLYSSGGAVPFQAEGLIMGYPFYMRSRWGEVSLLIQNPRLVQLERPVPISEHSPSIFLAGDTWWSAELEGTVYSDDFADMFEDLVTRLEPHPFLYKFSTVESDWSGEPEYLNDELGETRGNRKFTKPAQPLQECFRYSWGHHPEEAYHRIISDNASHHLIDRKYAAPIPLNRDERVIPEKPDFDSLLYMEWFNTIE